MNKWQREVLDKLREGRQCPDPDHRKIVLGMAGVQLRFLGENLTGGNIVLDDGTRIGTGTWLKCMSEGLGDGVTTDEGLDKLVKALERMLASHDAHTAKLPDDN